jgi:hypothetical protein
MDTSRPDGGNWYWPSKPWSNIGFSIGGMAKCPKATSVILEAIEVGFGKGSESVRRCSGENILIGAIGIGLFELNPKPSDLMVRRLLFKGAEYFGPPAVLGPVCFCNISASFETCTEIGTFRHRENLLVDVDAAAVVTRGALARPELSVGDVCRSSGSNSVCKLLDRYELMGSLWDDMAPASVVYT